MGNRVGPSARGAGAPWVLAAAMVATVSTGCGAAGTQAGAERARSSAVAGSASNDWSYYRYDVAGQSDVAGSLTAAQARGLTTAWTFPAASDANPIVVGGTAYITVANGTLVAVDVTNGQLLWSQSIGTAPITSCTPFLGRPVGAAAVVGSSVFVPGGDGSVHAFDKDTGQPLWSSPVANVASNEFLWASAFPVNGWIFVGVASLYEPICGPAVGHLVALDEATGQVVGTWWVDPQRRPGGGIWTRPAYDPATNRLFLTTGQGQTGLNIASQPMAQAFVALAADTLQAVDSFQPVTAPFSADSDFGASPTLFDLADGRHLIAAANKDGFVYALDRDHLAQGIVWSYQVSVAGDSPDEGTSTIVSAAYANGSLFVGGGQTPDGFAGAVAALDPATGAPRWIFHPDGFVLAGLTAAGDVLVAAATHLPDRTGRLYVLDQASGTVLYELDTPGPLFAQASFAAGLLFVCDASGTVYALRPAPPAGGSSGGSSLDFSGGFTASGLQLNGTAALSGTRLRLTNGGNHEAASAFFTTPMSVQSFTTDFSFQLTSASADGLTFTIQGIGPTALGPGGGGLGYGPDSPSGSPGIRRSVAVKFDLYDNAGEGIDSTGLYVDGASPTVPSVNLAGSGIDLHGGHVFDVHLTYDGATLAMTIADASTAASTTVTFPVDIPGSLGSSTAYVGFTAGTGGLTATQDILSWTFSPGGSTSQMVATPTFSPVPGVYGSAQSVTLSDATPGATIHYTTDGTTPTTSSATYAGPIPVGATTTIKAFATAAGFTDSAVASGTFTIQTASPGTIDFASGFTASGLQLNGTAALSGTRLRLTNGGNHEAASAFFTTPMSVQSFTTDFSFQLTSASADGLTFTIQGIGPTALGPGGGGLGYGPDSPSGSPGIGRSVAVKFDLYDNAGEGTNSTGLYTNGASPTVPSVNLSGVNLHSGDIFNVHISYDGASLAMTIADSSTGAITTVTFPVDIPGTVGSTSAYVGFTAGTGGLTATQDLLAWTYAGGPPPAGNFTLAASPSSVATSGGGSTTSTISVTEQNGFSGTVSLSASGIPTGATATLNPTSVNGSGSSTLTLSAGSAAAGTYTVTVTGTGGSLAHSTDVSWTISTVASPSPIFSDEFNRTTGLGINWSVQYGSFTTDGTYAVSGTPPTNGNWASVVATLGTNDYSVVGDIIIPSGSLYSGIVARSSVPGYFDSDLYAAQISANGTVNLYRRNNWNWTQLGSVAAGIVAGMQYTLELVTTGSSPVHLEVWLNGAKSISYDDSSSSRITAGIPGLENYNGNVKYNSFRVYTR